MQRREFMTLFGGAAAAWPMAARAQQRRPRIAVLSLYSAEDEGKGIAAFVDGLRALGYIEGQNVDIDYRYADGDRTQLAPMARKLAALKPDVALANASSPVLAIKDIAPNLPIVCPQFSSVLIPRFAASYARPGGSVTGIAGAVEDLYAKLPELALDILPGSARIGLLANPAGASMALWAQKIEAATRSRGVTLLIQEVRTPDNLAAAFEGFASQQVQVVVVPANGLFVTRITRIAQLAIAAHLPTIFPDARDVRAGGLASYGVDHRDNYRRAATYVAKVLKGIKPGDLPIEFPTKLVLTINLKTAKALGLTIPATVLARADEVIE